jgi:type 1 glutamine amidotransferase
MTRKALIVFGGWDGHAPKQVADMFRDLLQAEGFSVDVSDTLASLTNLSGVDLIVPHWTMGSITDEQLKSVSAAVRGGVGLAGCHGGMCDAFHHSPAWHFITGGIFVAHPGDSGLTYTVRITDHQHPITKDMSDFDVRTEQYYMLVDPAVKVLATSHFPLADGPHVPNGPVEMPLVWTKFYGKGRVFYCSLGHDPATLALPPVRELMRRGFLWAANSMA